MYTYASSKKNNTLYYTVCDKIKYEMVWIYLNASLACSCLTSRTISFKAGNEPMSSDLCQLGQQRMFCVMWREVHHFYQKILNPRYKKEVIVICFWLRLHWNLPVTNVNKLLSKQYCRSGYLRVFKFSFWIMDFSRSLEFAIFFIFP